MRILVALLLTFSSLSLASRSSLKLTNFAFGGIRFTPQSWETSTYIEGAWTPTYDFDRFAVRLGIGITRAKDVNKDPFMSTNYETAIMVPLASIFGIEAVVGMRNFHDHGGLHPEYGGGFIARTGEVFDRLYITFVHYDLPGNSVNVFKSGTALNF